jgi:hypothetical protein
MKEIIIQRLYKGMIDIRSGVLNKCFVDKTSIKILLQGNKGFMLLKPEEFKAKAVKISKKEFKSKFAGNDPYKLVSYKWEPIN